MEKASGRKTSRRQKPADGITTEDIKQVLNIVGFMVTENVLREACAELIASMGPQKEGTTVAGLVAETTYLRGSARALILPFMADLGDDKEPPILKLQRVIRLQTRMIYNMCQAYGFKQNLDVAIHTFRITVSRILEQTAESGQAVFPKPVLELLENLLEKSNDYFLEGVFSLATEKELEAISKQLIVERPLLTGKGLRAMKEPPSEKLISAELLMIWLELPSINTIAHWYMSNEDMISKGQLTIEQLQRYKEFVYDIMIDQFTLTPIDQVDPESADLKLVTLSSVADRMHRAIQAVTLTSIAREEGETDEDLAKRFDALIEENIKKGESNLRKSMDSLGVRKDGETSPDPVAALQCENLFGEDWAGYVCNLVRRAAAERGKGVTPAEEPAPEEKKEEQVTQDGNPSRSD